MDVPHHADSMTDSSDSLDDDQMLFDIIESHDDTYSKALSLPLFYVCHELL